MTETIKQVVENLISIFILANVKDLSLGAVVRTRTDVKPVFVSIGHRLDLDTCIRIVLKSCRGYHLPEPLRRADHLSRENYNHKGTKDTKFKK